MNSKIYCNSCKTITNHEIKHEYCVQEIEDNELIGIHKYQILQCKGCDTISFRMAEIYDNMVESDDNGKLLFGQHKEFELIFPERHNIRLREKSIIGTPLLIRKTYKEIIEAYNIDLNLLCAVGLRSLIEAICKHFNIKGDNLGIRIDNLSHLKLISQELSQALQNQKFLGNFAAHRLEFPEKEELKSAIELLEIALENIFSVPIKHNELKQQIAKRINK